MLKHQAKSLKTRSLALAATLLLATHVVAQSETMSDSGSDPRILPDLEQERLQALAQSQLPDTQTLWLETQHESFLGLFKPANSPQARGAVLLLPHDRTSADWPGIITSLRQGLPDQGWHTLSIALPDEPEYIPPRMDTLELKAKPEPAEDGQPLEQQPSPKNAERALDEHYEQISARIEAGLKHLQQHNPRQLLILGEGSGAYWGLRFSIENSAGAGLLPVLIDAVPPIAPVEPRLAQLAEQLRRPTLDLYHGNGLGQQRIEVLAKRRKEAALRQGKGLLLSSRMTALAGNWRQPDRRLLGTLRGMLDKLVINTAEGRLQQQSSSKAQP
jgi:hypothetical protein